MVKHPACPMQETSDNPDLGRSQRKGKKNKTDKVKNIETALDDESMQLDSKEASFETEWEEIPIRTKKILKGSQ